MNKKLLGVLGVAALLLAGNFAWQEVKEVDAANTQTIYLKPSGNWLEAGAKFEAWTWGGSAGDSWVSFEDTDGDFVYEATLPSDKTGMKILRKGPDQSSNSWDSWADTGDLSIPKDGKNMYSFDGWHATNKKWSTFTRVEPIYSVVGTMNGWNLATDELVKVSNYKYEKVLKLSKQNYTFKIAKDKSWDISVGSNTAYSSGDLLLKVGENDISYTPSTSGSYLFVFDAVAKSINIKMLSDDELVSRLFKGYYNNGSYTKVTTLNVNEFAENEVFNYFHAGAQAKYRQTVYSDGQLVMKSSKVEVADWNKITNTSTYKDVTGGVAHLKNGEEDYRVSGTVNGEDRSSVENWFVTLCDFKDSIETGWTYADGVYSFDLRTSEALTNMARQFVAPMWLNTTEAQNYVVFISLTVEEDNGSLVMKLFASGDTGKVTDTNGVFAQATITK